MTNESKLIIDNYEPYFHGIRVIHSYVYNELLNTPFVKKETEMVILQCNYQEYVSYGHDANYIWFRLCFNNEETRDFALGINKLRFVNEERVINKLIDKLKEGWKNVCNTSVIYISKIEDVSSLKKEPYEMILSVHYWFDKMLIDDGINDTQYMKIVYTGESLSNNLEKIQEAEKE